MGLDLYAGSLSRYHSADWEIEAVRAMRAMGVGSEVRYTDGPPVRPSKDTAGAMVALWRRNLELKYAHIIKQGLKWVEIDSMPYFARKSDYDGRRALILAGAYAEHPELTRPTQLPSTYDEDPAYAEISKDYTGSIVSILECHMFLPSTENFLIAEPDAIGVMRYTTSTANLAGALRTVNQAHWRADDARIEAWDKRGALTQRVVTIKDGKATKVEEILRPEDSFVHAAQFGFGIYNTALRFSRLHNLPIATDE